MLFMNVDKMDERDLDVVKIVFTLIYMRITQ